jgi:hypothetical protein
MDSHGPGQVFSPFAGVSQALSHSFDLKSVVGSSIAKRQSHGGGYKGYPSEAILLFLHCSLAPQFVARLFP